MSLINNRVKDIVVKDKVVKDKVVKDKVVKGKVEYGSYKYLVTCYVCYHSRYSVLAEWRVI